jgi:hypothetical protein
MKIKIAVAILLVFMTNFMLVGAQPAHSCGTISSMSVAYDRDAAGYMPRFKEGSQDQFNCIAARDPNFSAQRFDAGWKALNYWFTLYGQELGVLLQPLPAPTN